jgi:hypothetical protein
MVEYSVSDKDKKEIVSSLSLILGIVKGEQPYTKTLIVDAFMRKLVKMPNESRLYAIDMAKKTQEKSGYTLFQKNHKFWGIAKPINEDELVSKAFKETESKTSRSPKYKVGDYVSYEGGDIFKERWYGIIMEVKDFIKEYAYRIDAYAYNEDESIMFDSELNNEKYEVQLNLLNKDYGFDKFSQLRTLYEKSRKPKDISEPTALQEASDHIETFEKIQQGEIKTPEDLGESIEQDHEVKNLISREVQTIEQNEKEIKPISILTGQDKINSEVRALLKSKGLNRYLYTKSDFNLLAQYTGDSKTQEEKADGYLWDYFTPDEAVKLCWQLSYKYGFRATESKRILESAAGVGRFLRYAPDYCQVTAYEIDETSYMICKLLYPNFNIINKSFESAFYVESGLRGIAYKPVYDTYNLVIGNPPYMYPYTSVYKDKEKIVYPFIQSLEQLFIIRGVDSLEKNGLLIYIIPASIIDNNSSYQEFKDALFKKAVMLDAIRLPSGTFKGTNITTDIVCLQKR